MAILLTETRCREIIAAIMPLMGGVPCKLIDEPDNPAGGTKEGNLCRLRRWIRYLLGALLCESSSELNCCEDNETEFWEGWNACPL